MDPLSRRALFFLLLFLVGMRLHYAKWETPTVTNVLTWDAFGYYLLLPSNFIYNDFKKMEWVEGIVTKYHTTGNLYQLHELSNGNRVMKYFIGISILYLPFFLLAHLIAMAFGFPQDGFSASYQLGISLAAITYAFLALLVLRKVLLKFFEDKIVALVLILLVLGTNYAQYVAVDSGQTHGYIFALYAFLLFAVVRWHERPSIYYAFGIGFLTGLGILCRPTEAVMLLLPVFYGMQDGEARKAKWKLVVENRRHIFVAMLAGMLALFPQFLYWKAVTGHWIYDVGAKFEFFQPHWRVLFGWEKGWFIYTPLVVLMVTGLYFLKRTPFYTAILIFFIINTWIVIAWSDWHYGATYSSRALVQSYAVMAIPMGAILDNIFKGKRRTIVMAILVFLVCLNIFQLWQYNKTILHYRDMNRKYYQAIFLNPNPDPYQLSLLDTGEYIRNETSYQKRTIFSTDTSFVLHGDRNPGMEFFKLELAEFELNPSEENWIKISAEVKSDWGAFDSFITATLEINGRKKETKCRLENGMSKRNHWNEIGFYFIIPKDTQDGQFSVGAITTSKQDIQLRNIAIVWLSK